MIFIDFLSYFDIKSSIISINLLICLNLSYFDDTIFKSFVNTPNSISAGILSPSFIIYFFDFIVRHIVITYVFIFLHNYFPTKIKNVNVAIFVLCTTLIEPIKTID